MNTVTTYPSTGGRGKNKKCIFQKGKCVGVATNVYSRKTLEKPKRGLRILKIRVRELFMRKEGISTPRARHKGRQPLVCKNMTSILFTFPFLYIFLFFWGRQGCCPCSYVSLGAMRNSDLRSSLSLKVYVLH